MEDIQIRTPNLEDCYNIVRLLIPQFSDKSNEELSENKYFQDWFVNFKTLVESPLIKSFIALNSLNEIVGTITVYLLPRLELIEYYSVIEDVFIKESERSKGIGTVLFQEVFKFLKENNVKFVTLNVRKDNVDAQRFYSRLGFENKEFEMGFSFK